MNVTISSNNDISDSTIVLTDITGISPENDSAGELYIPTMGVTASISTNYSRLESTTYDNNEGAVVLEFAKAMTLNEGANGTVRIDGADYGVSIPSSALSSNGKILTIDTDVIGDFPVISPRTSMTINVDGLLYGGNPKNIMEEMVSDIPTPVIPGGDVGDEGGVVQLMRYVTDPTDDANIMEERDEDQRLSKEEYDLYTYPDQSVSEIVLKIDLAAIPNYAPQMDDNVYIIIDGNIVATSMVTDNTIQVFPFQS